MVDLKTFQIETDLVPSPVQYDVLLPKGYEESNSKFPLMLFLHGGGQERHMHLKNTGPQIWEMWEKKIVPEMVIVTPLCTRCFYMNYRNGSEKWESFIINELLPHLQNNFRVSKDLSSNFIGGISMGGLGSLRIGFKYLEKFGAIISFEPGIEPAFKWKDVETMDKFYRSKELMEKIFGSPFDEDYWNRNNPANIVRERTKKIRQSGIKIYLEVGTEDFFGLFRGAEFLHRILFDHNIPHEYRYVLGADHIGISLRERITNGFSFLNRVINPLEEPQPVIQTRKFFKRLKEETLGKEGKSH